MEGPIRLTIRALMADAATARIPKYTCRSVYVPGVKGKALAVIGMRRSGKTTSLWQCLADRLAAGVPRVWLIAGPWRVRRHLCQRHAAAAA